jgi:hypothetical protein
MEIGLKLDIPPAILPVTIDEAKIHERIDIEDQANDASILAILGVATQLAQNYTRRAFITQGYIYETTNWQPVISIPRPPLIDVDPTSVKIRNSYNVITDVDPTLFFIDRIYTPGRFIWRGFQIPYLVTAGPFIWGGWNWGSAWWYGYTLIMKFTGGYGDTADLVPIEIKQGILQIFGSLYENRESQIIPPGAKQLLQPYKVEYL